MAIYPEKVQIEQQQYKQIKAGKKLVTSWLTSDGVYHDTEAKALRRQAELDAAQRRIDLWKSIKSIEFSEFDHLNVPDTFYYAETQEQLDLITEQLKRDTYSYHFINGNHHNKASFKIGDWIGHLYEDGGDYKSTYSWFTLEYLVNEIKQFLEKAEGHHNATGSI